MPPRKPKIYGPPLGRAATGPRVISFLRVVGLFAALLAAMPADAQDRGQPDRSDPSVIQRELERQEPQLRPQQGRVQVRPPEIGTAVAPTREVVASAIRVTGATRIPAAAFATVVEPYLGRPLAQGDLVRLATDVADVIRRSGYGLATAWVPAQELTAGVLAVQVDEGRIHAVRASGPAAGLVEQRLRAMVGDGPIRTGDLERQLLLIGDMAGMWVGDARLVREGDRNVLTVNTRQDRAQAVVRLDNWGTSAVGPVRLWAEIDVNSVATKGDVLTFGASVTPLQPQEFQFVEARYRVPVGPGGTMVGVGGYIGHTRSEDTVAANDFEGDSNAIELDVIHPVSRSRDTSLWLTGHFELRDSRLDQNGTRVRKDRIASATASAYGYARFAGGRIRARATLVQGLDLFDATRPGDPLASRADADGTFTKLETWADYLRPLGGGFSLELAARSQISDGPLLASEEMGLGGPQFLRAFNYRELSGDEGVAGSAELRFDMNNVSKDIDTVGLYAFVDGGHVTDHDTLASSGNLASGGIGARVRFGRRWEAGAEFAVPLTDGGRDWDPKPRLSFAMTARF